MRILLVEDDGETAEYVPRGLTEAGHLVDRAVYGREGLTPASAGGYDALVVDRMLPKLDGLGLVRALRAAGVKTPALFLTVRASGSPLRRARGAAPAPPAADGHQFGDRSFSARPRSGGVRGKRT